MNPYEKVASPWAMPKPTISHQGMQRGENSDYMCLLPTTTWYTWQIWITCYPPHESSDRGIEHVLHKDVLRVFRRDVANLDHRKPSLHLKNQVYDQMVGGGFWMAKGGLGDPRRRRRGDRLFVGRLLLLCCSFFSSSSPLSLVGVLLLFLFFAVCCSLFPVFSLLLFIYLF